MMDGKNFAKKLPNFTAKIARNCFIFFFNTVEILLGNFRKFSIEIAGFGINFGKSPDLANFFL